LHTQRRCKSRRRRHPSPRVRPLRRRRRRRQQRCAVGAAAAGDLDAVVRGTATAAAAVKLWLRYFSLTPSLPLSLILSLREKRTGETALFSSGGRKRRVFRRRRASIVSESAAAAAGILFKVVQIVISCSSLDSSTTDLSLSTLKAALNNSVKNVTAMTYTQCTGREATKTPFFAVETFCLLFVHPFGRPIWESPEEGEGNGR